MRLKTVVFWILWVGNDLTLQTVREQNPDRPSPASFPSHLQPQLGTVLGQARDEEAVMQKLRSDQVGPALSAE
jgi:hypothetical protein